MASGFNTHIVAEDSNEYLIIAENIYGDQRALWMSKFAVPGSLAAQWKTTRAESLALLEIYKQDPNVMDAFGTQFVNVYFQPDVMHAVVVEPASLALWNTLTTKHHACEIIRVPVKVDEVARQDYLVINHLRDVAHQATSPLSDRGHFEGATSFFGSLPSPRLSTEHRDTDILDAGADRIQAHDIAQVCQDLPCIHNDQPSVVFKCDMPEHGEEHFYSCTLCSENAVLGLTPKQQDAYDFGAIFPLCKSCGVKCVNDDIVERLCTCLAPQTKCSSCVRTTLDGLAHRKKRASLRTFHAKCCLNCRAELNGSETIGQCAYCRGLEIDEPK